LPGPKGIEGVAGNKVIWIKIFCIYGTFLD
jgi:hypothetical protein